MSFPTACVTQPFNTSTRTKERRWRRTKRTAEADKYGSSRHLEQRGFVRCVANIAVLLSDLESPRKVSESSCGVSAERSRLGTGRRHTATALMVCACGCFCVGCVTNGMCDQGCGEPFTSQSAKLGGGLWRKMASVEKKRKNKRFPVVFSLRTPAACILLGFFFFCQRAHVRQFCKPAERNTLM